MTKWRSLQIRRFDRSAAHGHSRVIRPSPAVRSPPSPSPSISPRATASPSGIPGHQRRDPYRVRVGVFRPAAPNPVTSPLEVPLWRRRNRPGVRRGASLGRAPTHYRRRHLHHTTHRIADGVVLPVDSVREPAQWREAFDALGGCGGRCVRHRHGRKGIDGDSAADGHPLRPHLPVRLFPRSRGAAVAAVSRPDAHVAVSRISARRRSARRLCGILYGHLCVDVPLESIRDDLPVFAARRVADGSRHHVWRARCVRPFRCPHRIGDCRRVVVVDRGGVSPMADRRVSRCVVLHDAGALIELRSDRHRGRRRTADVFAADGLDHGRRRGSLWSSAVYGHAPRELWPRSVLWLRRQASDWQRWLATPIISPG